MKRKDIIFQEILQNFGHNTAFTTLELSERLNMNRANVSHELNKLVREELLNKKNTRPVKFILNQSLPLQDSIEQINKNRNTIFQMFFQENISLRPAIDQAKSAVLYPPIGMHTLLLGETGVGKTMFASIMHTFAIESGRLQEGAPFITFNCADYANNPQLLLGQLFGVKKGAYTGAVQQKGLLEKAHNGILFLDEIHRLSPEGQEMLFTFIDHGFFRRLGETENENTANVFIICATTENPESSLLNTFSRRIPMTISIPPLRERTYEERFLLIKRFFFEESKRIGKDIYVSTNSMRSFIFYQCRNNIGQLKTDIQLACAKAYSEYVTGKRSEIKIFSTDLQWYIKEGLFIEKKTKHSIPFYDSQYIFNVTEGLLSNISSATTTIYDQIDHKYEELKNREVDHAELALLLESDIQSYFTHYLSNMNKKISKDNLLKIVSPDIVMIGEKIISLAENTLHKAFDEKIVSGLCLHIQTLLQRIQTNKPIYHPNINGIRQKYKQPFSIALDCIKLIEEEFQVNIPFDEVAFITMFFVIENDDHYSSHTKVLVLAHGNGIAKEMASVTNHLLINDAVIGIDMPLHESPKVFLDRVKTYIRSIEAPAGILLLIDMGSLAFIGEMIEKEFHIPVRVVPMVSTAHVLEASRKAQIGYNLDELYQDVKNLTSFYLQTRKEQSNKQQELKSVILTACLTGEGSAVAIKTMLENYLHYDKNYLDILPISIFDKKELQVMLSKISKERNILCLVCNFDIEVPFLTYHLKDILSMKATKMIQELITIEETYSQMAITLEETLQISEGRDLIANIRKALRELQNATNKFINLDSMIGIVLHISCMVDRLQKHQPLTSFSNKDEYMNNHYRLYVKTKQCLINLESIYNISIPDDEICYIVYIFFENEEIITMNET